jgi:hypothetical protein
MTICLNYSLVFFLSGIGMVLFPLFIAWLSTHCKEDSGLQHSLVILSAMGLVCVPLGLFLMIWGCF